MIFGKYGTKCYKSEAIRSVYRSSGQILFLLGYFEISMFLSIYNLIPKRIQNLGVHWALLLPWWKFCLAGK